MCRGKRNLTRLRSRRGILSAVADDQRERVAAPVFYSSHDRPRVGLPNWKIHVADDSQSDILTLTAELVASYLGSNTHVPAAEIPNIIRSVRGALTEENAPASTSTESAFPKADKRAVNKSITPDALISFVDNKPYKTLKRHLSRHGLDMAGYRERYGLPSDYPSVAPSYSAARSEMAKKLGLGAQRRKGGSAAAADKAKPAGNGRRRKAEPAG